MPPATSPIIIFDTDCLLCSTMVHFVLRHEASPALHFASTRKPQGQALAKAHGYAPEDLDRTFVVVHKERALTKSDAGLTLLQFLRAPWPLLRVARLVPRPLRDWVYDLVARNRLRWFGQAQDCFVPTPELRARFLDEAPTHRQTAARPE